MDTTNTAPAALTADTIVTIEGSDVLGPATKKVTCALCEAFTIARRWARDAYFVNGVTADGVEFSWSGYTGGFEVD